MYISHKSNTIQQIAHTEWECRMLSKGMTTDEYWPWLDSISSGDKQKTPDYSGETGYTIVECTDEDVMERLSVLNDYISHDQIKGKSYNIKYYASKRDAEELKDTGGKSHDPKQYVQSHFVPDDTAKDKRILDEEWTRIRAERTRLLAETDHLALSDQTLSADMKTYRTKLRDLPSDQSSKTKYSDITWPTKP